MYMKTGKLILFAIITLLLTNISGLIFAQTGEPWTANDLIEPAALANQISNPKETKPAIFNVGPLADIKGAVNIGSVNNQAGLDKLKKSLATVPKDKVVVIYCGCCPFRNCPNIRPAFNLLKQMGYKNPRLLNLKQNLKVDWMAYGYPMN
jgi:thiosulfate/3-mercaptopyruvate sulfurtransferase